MPKLKKSAACVLALAFGAGAALLDAAQMRLDFIPTQMESWHNFVIADRLVASVFSGSKLSVEPRLPKDMSKLSKDRQDELKVHLWLFARSPELYERYLRLVSLSPTGLSWKEVVGMLGFDAEEITKAVEGEKGEALVSSAKPVGQDGAKLWIGEQGLSVGFDLTAMAQSINERLPAGERVEIKAERAPAADKPKVEVVVINGEKYASWAKIEPQALDGIKRLPFDLQIKEMDASSSGARAILEETGVTLVPAVLFKPLNGAANKSLDDFAQRGAIEKKGKKGGWYFVPSLSSSGVFWAKKESKSKNLDLFIMSQCPYGVAAQRAVLSAEKDGKFPKDVQLSYRYIVDKEGQSPEGTPIFRSLHGDGELEENIRQMVLQRHMPDKLNCYLGKRLENINSSLWSDVLESCGVDMAKFKQLYKENSAELVESDYKLVESLGVRSSPTFIWRGRYALTGLGSLHNVEEFKDVDFKSASSGGTPAGKCQ
ncbi:MAG: hypothetical protein HYT79_11780 [Elusimicrobia bacterium]|nr:hypothetical protein [Elusimicrobiota bacterium]